MGARNTIGFPNNIVRRSLNWLVEPADGVQGDAARSQARVLAALLLPTAVSMLMGVMAVTDFLKLSMAVGALIIALAYSLSRTQYYLVAAWLTIIVLSVPSFLTLLASQNPTVNWVSGSLVWLVLPLLLAGLVFSIRSTVIVAAGHMAIILIMVAILPDLSIGLVGAALGLLGTVAILILSSTVIREQYFAKNLQQFKDLQKAKETLLESEEMARALLNASTDSALLIDLEGIIVGLNDPAASRLNKRAEELVGANLFDEAQADMTIFNKSYRDKIVRTGEPIRVEMEQDDIWLDTNIFPVYDAQGDVAWLAINARDITDLKLAEKHEREQRALADALREIGAILNSTLHVDEVLEHILANVERVVAHDAVDIMLVEDDTVRLIPGRGYRERGIHAWARSMRLPLSDLNYLHKAVQTGRLVPVVIPETSDEPHWIDIPETSWIRSYAGAPIGLEGRITGFINVNSAQPNFYTADHAERLQAFANQAAIAIQNARLYEQASELAALQERQRLARELHDAVSQSLFSANVIAEMMIRLWERDPEQVKDGLKQLAKLTRGALAEMRALLLELRPAALERARLGDLLDQLTDATSGQLGIPIAFKMEGKPALPTEVRIAFYRIAQEALNNVVKHARATQVQVRLSSQSDRVQLVVSDNGRGFEKSNVSPERLGLTIMQERADAIGAELGIIGNNGNGTQVTLVWLDSPDAVG